MMLQGQGRTRPFVYEEKIKSLSIEGNLATIKELTKSEFGIDDHFDLEALMVDGTEELIRDEEDVTKLAAAAKVYVYPWDILKIKIGNDTYSLDEAPPGHSNLVNLAIHEVLYTTFNVADFVLSLGDSVEHLRQARNHLLAGDQQYLASGVSSFVQDCLQPLIENSTTVIDTVVKNSCSVLKTLTEIFVQFRDGQGQSGADGVKTMCEVMRVMVDKSGALANELKDAEEECKKLQKKTSQEQVKKDNFAAEYEEKLQQKKRELDEDRNNMIKNASYIYRIWYWFLRQEYESSDYVAKKKKFKEYENEIKKQIKVMKKVQDHLSKAVDGIRTAQLLIRQMCAFWRSTQKAIDCLQAESFVSNLPDAFKGPRRKVRFIFQRNRIFRQQAITFMSKFVAIRDVSIAFRNYMVRNVMEDITKFLKESPSAEQAMRMLRAVEHPDPPPASKEWAELERFIPKPPSRGEYPAGFNEARKAFQLPYGYEVVRVSLHAPAEAQLPFSKEVTDDYCN